MLVPDADAFTGIAQRALGEPVFAAERIAAHVTQQRYRILK